MEQKLKHCAIQHQAKDETIIHKALKVVGIYKIAWESFIDQIRVLTHMGHHFLHFFLHIQSWSMLETLVTKRTCVFLTSNFIVNSTWKHVIPAVLIKHVIPAILIKHVIPAILIKQIRWRGLCTFGGPIPIHTKTRTRSKCLAEAVVALCNFLWHMHSAFLVRILVKLLYRLA